MATNFVDPKTLIGDELLSATVGWHVHAEARLPVQYFLRFRRLSEVKVRPMGDGSIALIIHTAPPDFDMKNYGRFEFRAAGSDSPLARLLGRTIVGVDAIHWHGTEVGLRIHVDDALVVLANSGDEVFVSNGDLPPDHEDATIA